MISVRKGLFQVELRSAGAGEPLVFLHGGGGFTGWAPFLDDLAQDHTVTRRGTRLANRPAWST
jgi:hypothetical protein